MIIQFSLFYSMTQVLFLWIALHTRTKLSYSHLLKINERFMFFNDMFFHAFKEQINLTLSKSLNVNSHRFSSIILRLKISFLQVLSTLIRNFGNKYF